MRRRYAFTLLEMMVSVAILGLVTIYLTDMLVRQSRTYQVVDQVTEAQQSARAIADLMEREVRTTGFMVPEAASFCGVDRTDDSDILVVTDADAVEPRDPADDELDVLLGLGASVSSGYVGTGTDDLVLGSPAFGSVRHVIDGRPAYDTNDDGAADSDFLYAPSMNQFGAVIVADRDDPGAGTACGLLTDVQATEISVDWTMGGRVSSPHVISTPTDLVAVPANVYWVENNQLFRNGLLLADDVEDLQFAVWFDADGDGEVAGEEDAEYPGSSAYVPTGAGVYESDAWDHRSLREVRMNIVVLSRGEDPDVLANPASAQGLFQAMENRVDPTGGALDGFRRRVHSVSIRPRNVGLRLDES